MGTEASDFSVSLLELTVQIRNTRLSVQYGGGEGGGEERAEV